MKDGKAKYIKRFGTTMYKDVMLKTDWIEDIRISDILADDWEVVKEKKKKTRTLTWGDFLHETKLPHFVLVDIPSNAKVTIEWEE
jgi:hypothetical protein